MAEAEAVTEQAPTSAAPAEQQTPAEAPQDTPGGQETTEAEAAPEGTEDEKDSRGVLSKASEPAEADEAGEGDGEEGADEPSLPEEYDFSELGLELSEEHLSIYDGVFRELGLNQDQVGKLLEAERSVFETIVQQRQDAVEAQKAAWEKEAKSHEVLGKDWDETLHFTAAGVEAVGLDQDVIDVLESTGLSSHPKIIQAFSMLGRAIQSDSFEKGAPSAGETDLVSILYGDDPMGTNKEG